MLRRIAHLAIKAPWQIIAAAVVVMAAAAIFGIPVGQRLSASGFQDPTSESSKATQLLDEKFGQGDVQMLITVTAPGEISSGPARAVGLGIVDQLKRLAARRGRDLGVDGATRGRDGAGQQGWQVRTDRGRHHRRGE